MSELSAADVPAAPRHPVARQSAGGQLALSQQPSMGGDPAPLGGDEPSARRTVPPRTVTYWRVRNLLVAAVVVGLSTWGAAGLTWFTPTVRWIVVCAELVWLVGIGVLLRPVIRRRLFWYVVSPAEIDLQHGWLVRTRTVVPMTRVQHLTSEQGVLGRRFRLADVHIHTAAGAIVLHGLDDAEATVIRTRISALAHLADDL